jgi:hypothetical protein
VHFVFIVLSRLAAFNAEIMIVEARFRSDRTLPAGMLQNIRDHVGTFTGNAVTKSLHSSTQQ